MSNNKGKAVIFLIVLIIIAFGLGGGAYYLLQQEITRNGDLTQRLEEAESKREAVESELETAKNKIAVLQANITDAELKIADLTTGMEKEKASKNISLKELEQLKSDLEKELNLKISLQKDLDASVKSFKEIEPRLKEMENKVNELETLKRELEDKVKSLEEKVQNVELGKIVVSPDQTGVSTGTAAPANLEGKVAVVNKDYNFAVINLGNKDGVVVGSVFSVTHDNKHVGDLKIEKVHESMSAAGFVTPEIKDKIAEGDKVSLKK